MSGYLPELEVFFSFDCRYSRTRGWSLMQLDSVQQIRLDHPERLVTGMQVPSDLKLHGRLIRHQSLVFQKVIIWAMVCLILDFLHNQFPRSRHNLPRRLCDQ
jgi:hypothetical protein